MLENMVALYIKMRDWHKAEKAACDSLRFVSRTVPPITGGMKLLDKKSSACKIVRNCFKV